MFLLGNWMHSTIHACPHSWSWTTVGWRRNDFPLSCYEVVQRWQCNSFLCTLIQHMESGNVLPCERNHNTSQSSLTLFLPPLSGFCCWQGSWVFHLSWGRLSSALQYEYQIKWQNSAWNPTTCHRYRNNANNSRMERRPDGEWLVWAWRDKTTVVVL